jgi:hypothetical protein
MLMTRGIGLVRSMNCGVMNSKSYSVEHPGEPDCLQNGPISPAIS